MNSSELVDRRVVGPQDSLNRLSRVYPPVAVVTLGPEVEGIARTDDSEPIAFVGESQVPDKSEAGPARRQHRAAQLVVGEAIQLTDHVVDADR